MARERELLSALLGEQGSAEATQKIWQYLERILKWNRSMNLTGAQTLRALIEEHVADALPLAALPPRGTSFLDVGSGAGFPGMIVAILRPDLRLSFLEKNHKKVVFLRTCIREAALSSIAIEGSIEEPPAELPARFDGVVARAVFAPERWVEIGERFVAEGGTLYALLAGSPPPPAPASLPALELSSYTLPTGAARSIAMYRKASL